MAAFRLALEQGAPLLELDVRLTADDVLVVYHDDTLDRITGVAGAIEDLTLEEVVTLDAGRWFDTRFAGERIPQLADVLALAQAYGAGLDVEVKVRDRRDQMARALRRELQPYRARTPLVVSSFDDDFVATARPMLAPTPVCRIYDEHEGPDGFGPDQPFAILHGRLVTPQRVAAIHEAGARVLVWTIDRVEDMQALLAAGVDGICTNHPSRAVSLLARRG